MAEHKSTPQAFSRKKALMNLFEEIAKQKGKKLRTSAGEIRLEVLLSSTNNITFQINQVVNSANITTETRLRQGDSFMPTSACISLRKSATNDANGNIVSILRQWANPLVFTATAEAVNLESIFNAQMAVTVNSVAVSDWQGTGQYRRVGIAQQGVQLSQQAAAIGTNGAYLMDQVDGPNYGFDEWDQEVCFNGKSNQQVSLSFPGSPNLTLSPATGGTFNFAVLRFRGVLAQNGSDYIKDETISAFFQAGHGTEAHRQALPGHAMRR